MSKALELYVYTTPTWQEQGLLKVGHCQRGHYKERIKQQFNASNPEKPIILWVCDLPDGKKDHHIHLQLKNNGIQRKDDGAGKEWFYGSLEDVKTAFNQVVHGVKRKDNFSLRNEQKEAVDKACKWFNKNYSHHVVDSATHKNRFLLNAKMRFGKCFTGIHIAKAIKAKKTIVVTYKPRVIGEWMSAVNNHVTFDGWTGIRAKKSENTNELYFDEQSSVLQHSGHLVLCVSLQDLDIDEYGNVKDRLKTVLETKWDLLIFDEVHFGGQTNRVKNILKYLKPRFRLDLSGTPFRLIDEVDFCPEQVFTYSYLDEQKNKQEEVNNDPQNTKPFIYRQMPDLNLSTIEITDKDINDQREKFMTTDDRDFSLNELFKIKGSVFAHNDAVDHFLESLSKREHGATALSVYGKLGEKLRLPEKRHSVWWLNRVKSVALLIKKLKRHPVFSRYEIINATGGAKGDDWEDDDLSDAMIAKNKDDIISKIEKVNSGKINKAGTITLTCRKFLTGVTIKEWDSILILNDIVSAESYFQAIFRIQSAWFNKEKQVLKPVGYVFDFAVSRCLKTTYDYASALADQLDQQDSHNLRVVQAQDNLKKVIDGLCDTLKIKQFYEGSLKSDPVTSRQIFEAITGEGSKIALAKRITSNALVSFPSLVLLENYPHLYEALKNVKGYRSGQEGSVKDFIQIGEEAKRKKLENDKLTVSGEKVEKDNVDFMEKEKDKEKKNKKKWYATQIKRLAICMADFIYMTKFREYKIDHVIETKDSQFFKTVTGINKDDFSELCDKGFINRESLNRIVREFRHQEESSVNPEEYIFRHVKTKSS